MIAWLLAARLCGAIVATWPEVSPERACVAALAIDAERGVYPAELVAAISYHESRFDPRAVNGRCRGLMQVAGGPRSDAWAQVRAGVRKLDEARQDCGAEYLRGYASGRCDHGGASARAFRRLEAQLREHTAPRTWRGKAES